MSETRLPTTLPDGAMGLNERPGLMESIFFGGNGGARPSPDNCSTSAQVAFVYDARIAATGLTRVARRAGK
jgi:hypothetical protein